MKISLIIPVYNEEVYIRRCLQSVFNQIDKADEVIVVNNNSTDRTMDIVSQFPVKVVNESRQGMIPARNRGFNEAENDIIARCDADAVLPVDWIRNIKKIYQDESIDAISGPAHFYDIVFAPVINTFGSFMYFNVSSFILGYKPLYGPNLIIKKNIWEKVKTEVCFDEKKVHEDMDLSIHIHHKKGVIKVLSEIGISVSSRRMVHNPLSIFVEYPIRMIRTFIIHRSYLRES